MKFLAIEKEISQINWANEANTLKEEALHVFRLYTEDFIREIYFTDKKNAVLILESENLMVAKRRIEKLPLVQKGLIDFDIVPLMPYTGYQRIINTNDNL